MKTVYQKKGMPLLALGKTARGWDWDAGKTWTGRQYRKIPGRADESGRERDRGEVFAR
jgi:hypothetical protein